MQVLAAARHRGVRLRHGSQGIDALRSRCTPATHRADRPRCLQRRRQPADGKLNKAVVAQFLLSSPANAKAIDAIVHPAVFDSFEVSGLDWMESAILFESGAYKLVDKVVAVVAPLEVRIQRVMQRDNITREKALDWMNRQMNQDEVARKADFVVINDGETDLENQIIKIIEQCNKQF